MNQQILKWIKIVVMRTLRERNLTKLDVSTLISAGMLGYSQSLCRFDPTRNVKFKTYAEYRIKGAVLDEVRKMIGDERCKNKRPRWVDFDYSQIGDGGVEQENIESQIDFQHFMDRVPLDDREKEILQSRLIGLNLREISQKFGFSESRASQLLAKIKKIVYGYLNDELQLDFNLINYSCPACKGSNCVASYVQKFRCDTCDADLVIVDQIPILAVTDSLTFTGDVTDVFRLGELG